MKEIRKTTKTFKKLTIMSCMMLTLCLAVSACGGKDEAEGTKDTAMGLEPMAIGGESEAGTGTSQGEAASDEDQNPSSVSDSNQGTAAPAGPWESPFVK